MALTPYKNQQNQLNRSRSSSCSSPIRNRIVYQEIFSMGSSTLVRSYSCDQVFDKDENGRPIQTTQIKVSSFLTPEKKVPVNCIERKKEEVKGPRRLAVNFSSGEDEMKKNTNKVKQPSAAMTALRKFVIFIFLTATSSCVLYFYLNYLECSYVWDLEKTEFELEKNVFGQKQAVLKINSVLKACNSSSDMYIMVFTGGVGVGKTYSASIISHHFPWSSNKLITYSGYFASDVNKLLQGELSSCGCNLLTVDDLTVKGTKEALSLISLLSNKRQNNENFLIILIFQLRTEAERIEIINEFKNGFNFFHHIPFKPLSEDVIRRCFHAEMERLGVNIPENELSKLVKEKMNPVDVLKASSGCKGVTEDVASYYKRNLK